LWMHKHTILSLIIALSRRCKSNCLRISDIKDQPQRWLKEMWNKVYYTDIASN
jgi:hypothetical protein